jgi:DNA-binding NtrC family response regulator
MICVDDLPEEVRGAAVTLNGATPAATRITNAADAPPAASQNTPDNNLSFDEAVTNLERELLLQSLNKSGGNKMRAAKSLNMKRTTFVEKLKRLRIEDAAKLDEDERDAADAEASEK